MHEDVRPSWATPLVVLVALWGLALIVLTAFLIAMSLIGQPFSSSALIASVAVGFGAFVTLFPVLQWLRKLGNQQLRNTVLPGVITMVAAGAWLMYLLLQPSTGF